jgi:hypothetical protein
MSKLAIKYLTWDDKYPKNSHCEKPSETIITISKEMISACISSEWWLPFKEGSQINLLVCRFWMERVLKDTFNALIDSKWPKVGFEHFPTVFKTVDEMLKTYEDFVILRPLLDLPTRAYDIAMGKKPSWRVTKTSLKLLRFIIRVRRQKLKKQIS